MFLKCLAALCTTLVCAVSMAQYNDGYNLTWKSDSHYYTGNTLVVNKPQINAYGDFRRLKHDYISALGFCQARGYYSVQSWYTAETFAKHDRWQWTGRDWIHSNGRHYISTLVCRY